MKWILAIIIGLLLMSCSATQDQIVFGAVIPMTGVASSVGQSLEQGLQMAVSEVNAEGGIGGKEVQLIIQDSKSSPKEGVSAYRYLLDVEEPDLIITSLSSVSLALAPLASADQQLLVSTVATAPGITNEYTYRYYSTAESEAPKIAELATSLGIEKLGLLYLNDDYGKGIHQFLTTSYSGELVSEYYERTSIEFGTEFLKLQEAEVEGLVIIGFPSHLIKIIDQLKEYDWNTPVIGPSSVTLPEVRDSITSLSFDLYGQSPLNYFDSDQVFVDHYQAAAYDTISFAKQLIMSGDMEGKTFTGVLGSGTIVDHELSFEVVDAKINETHMWQLN